MLRRILIAIGLLAAAGVALVYAAGRGTFGELESGGTPNASARGFQVSLSVFV